MGQLVVEQLVRSRQTAVHLRVADRANCGQVVRTRKPTLRPGNVHAHAALRMPTARECVADRAEVTQDRAFRLSRIARASRVE